MVTLLFIAVALVGVLLIAVPRVRRRRGHGAKPAAWRPAPARGRAAAVSAPAATRTWSGGDELDDWDDDIGWVDDAPRASAPAPQPEPAARFAPADGNGGRFAWPERGAAATEAANGRVSDAPGRAADDAPAVTARAAEAEAPAVTARAAHAGAAVPGANGHAVPAERNRPPAADDGVAPLELEDDDWLAPPPVRRGFGSAATAAPGYAPPRGKPRKRLFSPVVLVGLYAVGGIGLVVLAVSLLSGMGAGSDREASPQPAPAAATTTSAPTPTPAATPPAAEGPSPAELARLRAAATADAGAAVAAAERAERSAERRRIARERRARARARARAEARRRAAAPPSGSTPVTPVTPSVPAPPAGTGGTGGTGGGGGGTPDCEFCIG